MTNALPNTLDLTEPVSRPEVILPDGETYTLRHPADLTLREQADQLRLTRRIERLLDAGGRGDQLSDKEAESLDNAVNTLLRIVIPSIADEQLGALTAVQKMRILAFTGEIAKREAAEQGEV